MNYFHNIYRFREHRLIYAGGVGGGPEGGTYEDLRARAAEGSGVHETLAKELKSISEATASLHKNVDASRNSLREGSNWNAFLRVEQQFLKELGALVRGLGFSPLQTMQRIGSNPLLQAAIYKFKQDFAERINKEFAEQRINWRLGPGQRDEISFDAQKGTSYTAMLESEQKVLAVFRDRYVKDRAEHFRLVSSSPQDMLHFKIQWCQRMNTELDNRTTDLVQFRFHEGAPWNALIGVANDGNVTLPTLPGAPTTSSDTTRSTPAPRPSTPPATPSPTPAPAPAPAPTAILERDSEVKTLQENINKLVTSLSSSAEGESGRINTAFANFLNMYSTALRTFPRSSDASRFNTAITPSFETLIRTIQSNADNESSRKSVTNIVNSINTAIRPNLMGLRWIPLVRPDRSTAYTFAVALANNDASLTKRLNETERQIKEEFEKSIKSR